MKSKKENTKRKIVVGISVVTLVIAGLLLSNTPSYSENNEKQLLKKIEALQQRVEELESVQNKETHHDPWGYSNHRRANRWDPFAEMQQMQEAMNRMFHRSFGHRGWSNGGMFSNDLNFNYNFDIKESNDGYEIKIDMAGLDNEKVDFQIDEHSLTVKGEHSRQDAKEDPNQYISSQSYGSFMKTIPLPEDADTTKVKTEKEGDSLVIRLPKKTS